MRNFILILLCLLFASALEAQTSGKSPVSGVGIVYNRETSFNMRMTTNRGFALGIEVGRLRTYYKTTFYHLGIGEIKHPKEQRQSANPSVSRSFRPYVFGKQNNFFLVRGGWGVKRYFTEKAKQKGVAMGMSYTFGPTIGILKPYYLALAREGDFGRERITHEQYSEQNKSIFLDNTRIKGASPFTRGFGDLSLLPGGSASIALHMDWGAFDEFIKALEIGIMVDAFPKAVPILVSAQNSPLFFNFFLNLQLGKRR